MSSLLPGLLALVQGVRDTDKCYSNNYSILNTTYFNQSSTSVPKLHSRYSVSVYFLMILFLLLISMVSFTFLNFSQVAIKSRKRNSKMAENDHEMLLQNTEGDEQDNEVNVAINNGNKNEIRILLILSFFGSLINYGFAPGLLSYSTLPYGNIYFNLSINLSKFIYLFYFWCTFN